MTRFDIRALEIHSNYVWNFDHVVRALEFIKRHDLTTLVLHRNDIVDQIVYPGALFGSRPEAGNIFERYQDIFRKLYKYTPTRRSGPYQRRDYLRRIIEIAKRQGTSVYFENKELSFPDILIELYPQLTKDGALCPSDPFWADFVQTKYRELFEDLPDLAGIITAPGTGESRLSISANRCQCELCKVATPQAWYRNLLMAMHAPITAAGKTLIVRDFVFDAKTQAELAQTMETLPSDVVISLKNTPHDYYPTFPDNPRLGDVGEHSQWIEYDTMGQYFGWGVGIAVIIEDYRQRMARAQVAGASGIILRTDWESLDGHSCFANFNLINLYAGSAIARDPEASPLDIYRRFLVDEALVAPGANAADIDAAARWTEALFATSWQTVAKSVFVQDCVFSDSSNYPVSLSHAFWLAEDKNSLRDWAPEKWDALAAHDENMKAIFREKDEAVALVLEAFEKLSPRPPALTDQAYDRFGSALTSFVLYVRGWRSVVRACMLGRYLDDQRNGPLAAKAPALLDAELAALRELAAEFRAYAERTNERFVVYNMLSPERLEALAGDLQSLQTRAVPLAVPA